MAASEPLTVALGVALVAIRGPQAGTVPPIGDDTAFRPDGLDYDLVARTTDARLSVTVAIPELEPYLLRVDFLVYVPGSKMVDVSYEYVPVGHALERGISIATAEADPETVQLESERAHTRFVEKWPLWFLLAELRARGNRGEIERVRDALIRGGYRYLPAVVYDFRARAGSSARIKEMAAAWRVDESRIHRWLQDAVAQGLLSKAERHPRQAA